MGELLVWVVSYFVVVGSSLLLFVGIQNIDFCLWFILEVLHFYAVLSICFRIFCFLISSL